MINISLFDEVEG